MVSVPGPDGLPEVDEWLTSVRLTPLMEVAAFVTAARELDRDPEGAYSEGVDGDLVRRFRQGEPAVREVALAALRARGNRLYRLTDGGTVMQVSGSTAGPIRRPVSDITYDQLVSSFEVRDDIDHPKVGPVSRWLTRSVTRWAMRQPPVSPPNAPR